LGGLIEKLRARKAEQSLDERTRAVSQAWRSQLSGMEQDRSYVMETYSDHVVVCAGEDYYSIPYSEADDEVAFDVDAAVPVERTWTEVTKTVTITKVDEDRQIAFGWAYVSEQGGEQVVDHSGEFVLKEDMEDAAYVFNMAFREGDVEHTSDVEAHLIESFVVTDEKLEKMGLADDALPRGWWTGWYLPDPEVFDRVRSGELPMLSIGGLAEREGTVVA